MTFPTRPSVPLPTWATSSTLKVDPGTTKRDEGWEFAGVGLSYGEAPPFQWVNNEAYNNGVWSTYFDAALTYISGGNLNPSRAIMIQTSSVSLGPIGTINFNAVSYFNTSLTPWNSSTGLFTCPITGLYNLTFFLHFITNNASFNQSPYIIMNKNGVNFIIVYNLKTYTAGTNTQDDAQFNIFLSLNAGDTLELESHVGTSFSYGGPLSNSPSQYTISWNI